MSATEIVEYGDLMSGANKFRSHYTSDVAGSAGDQYVQGFLRQAFSM
jgi:hypothetical protein